MSHHTHDHPDAEGQDRPQSRGEGEGFFEKVKEFFTGPADDHGPEDERLADDDRVTGDDRLPAEDERLSDEDDSISADERMTGDDGLVAGDIHTPTADEGRTSDAPTAADAPITDSVADSTESVDSTGSGWDGSDEPPELSVPGNEAVAAYSDTSTDDGAARSDAVPEEGSATPLDDSGNEALAAHSDASADDGAARSDETSDDTESSETMDAADESDYASRHGSGVDDSGVLADAPLGDAGDAPPAGAPAQADQGDAESEREDRERSEEEEQERARREEEFAREHDPATHDVEAGEEFRQQGDWTAAEHGGPQVQEPDGTVHDPDEGAEQGSREGRGDEDSGEGSGWGGDAGGPGEPGPDDVRDGGHGWGSAAPVEGGAMPLGHPVKAWHDTMTFVMPGEDGYEGSDAHEWFVDAEAAQRAGFRHAHGG